MLDGSSVLDVVPSTRARAPGVWARGLAAPVPMLAPCARRAAGARARAPGGLARGLAAPTAALPTVADLCDEHVGDARALHGGSRHMLGLQVLPNAHPLFFRSYGARRSFSGEIETCRVQDSNPSVRAVLVKPGHGRVLVVDGGGSARCALLGDQIAGLAVRNGWAGVLINGLCRDSAALSQMALGVRALGTHPCKSHKDLPGAVGLAVYFGGVVFRRGEWLAADEDGVIVAPSRLTISG